VSEDGKEVSTVPHSTKEQQRHSTLPKSFSNRMSRSNPTYDSPRTPMDYNVSPIEAKGVGALNFQPSFGKVESVVEINDTFEYSSQGAPQNKETKLKLPIIKN
jgi:hypothetical protein